MENNANLKSIIQYVIFLTLALTPLFFLTTTSNFFSTNKQMLFLVATALSLILWSIHTLQQNRLRLTASPLLLPLLFFLIATVLSLIFQPQSRTEALYNQASLFITLPIWFLIVSSLARSKSFVEKSLFVIIASTTLLALYSILHITYLYSLTSLPTWMATRAFTPAGSPLALVTTLLISLGLSLPLALSETDSLKKTILFVASGIQTAALVAYLSLMLPGQALALNLIPVSAGWSITLDALKNIRTFFVGAGIGNFSSLYTQAKPVFLNNTLLWNVTPQTSSNEILQIITSLGVLGFLAFAWIALRGLKLSYNPQKGSSDPEQLSLRIGLIITLIIFLLVPANITTYVFLFTILALLTIVRKYKARDVSDVVLSISARNIIDSQTLDENIKTQKTPIIPIIFASLSSVIVLLFLYFGSRAYGAEVNIKQASDALLKNDAQGVYQRHIDAIQKVPTLTAYRLSYSQINLSLANSIAQQENLSDQDRQQIAQLVQQAVREARVATTLQPANAQTWANLGNIYRNLINVAQGSDNFAAEAYATAINLDPANPILRIEYGGFFYQLAQTPISQLNQQNQNQQNNQQLTPEQEEAVRQNLLQNALQQFQMAIQLKPDFANGYYNLAKALELGGNIQGAYQAMQQVIATLPKDAPDYEKALTELSDLQAKLPNEEQQVQEPVTAEEDTTLTEPSPLPSPLPGGPITLPEENPSPSPESSSNPSPTPTL